MTSPSRVGSHSPASPRLPSPPPFPEVQIGHRSPSPSSTRSSLIATPDSHEADDYGAARRIRPGTKAVDMASGPPLVPLSELDSAFQLQEHLKSLYLGAITSPASADLRQPITRAAATSLATPPPGIDRSLWLYELCRFLVQRANTLVVGFFADNPPCSAANCPEMRASEWQYLCAVHDPPKSCCAIDYCCHTLDWAAGILTSQRHFPSRLTLGSSGKETANQAGAGGDAASVRQLTNIFRRVYRMFAHAWFQHRDVFWAVENQEGLYVFYKTVCDVYSLIPEDNYTVPPEAEGLGDNEKQTDIDGWTRELVHGSNNASTTNSETSRSTRPTSLDFGRGNNASLTDDNSTNYHGLVDSGPMVLGTGATQRRHKHTPSTGSFVTTIHEGDEDITSPPLESTSETSFFNKSAISEIVIPGNKVDVIAPKTARRFDSENEDSKDNDETQPKQDIPTIVAPDTEVSETSTSPKLENKAFTTVESSHASQSSDTNKPETSNSDNADKANNQSKSAIVKTDQIPSPPANAENKSETAAETVVESSDDGQSATKSASTSEPVVEKDPDTAKDAS